MAYLETRNSFFDLIQAVRIGDSVTAERIATTWTRTEREGYANLMKATSDFLYRANKDWDKVLKYPAENEE